MYLYFIHSGTLFLRSSYHYLLKNIAHVMSICNFDQCCIYVFGYLCICVCVFASQTPRNIVSEVLLPLPFKKYGTCHVYLQLWPMLYLRICVFVFEYLQVRHPGTLFLRSSYHYLFKNIAHVMSICNFDQCCICVFVYLYLCICKSDTREHCFWGPFRKYMVCMA